MRIKLKAQIYKTFVFPSLINGCKIWNWNFSQLKKLKGTQYIFLRTIAGKSWRDKISHVQLLRQITADMHNQKFDWANDTNHGASIMGIETYCRLVRLRYAGHITKKSKTKIRKIVIYGEVDEGMRKPGRPKKSVREGLRNDGHLKTSKL